MNSEMFFIRPLDYVELILKRWWLLIICFFLGAGAGWLFSTLNGEVYEARAEFASSIDFSKTGELTELEEDMAIVLIGDVIKSSAVIDESLEIVEEQGLDITAEMFAENRFLERSNNHWVLIVRGEDPQIAAQMANIWAETAQVHLNSAFEHALSARQLEIEIEALNLCLEQSDEDQTQGSYCAGFSLAELQAEIDSKIEGLQQESEMAQGLLADSSAALVETASLPSEPVLYGRNSLLFFGGLIGLLLGFTFLLFKKH